MTTRLLHHLANRPLALLPQAFQRLAYSDVAAEADPWMPEVIAGIAVIPVRGSLGNDFWADTRYASIRLAFMAALAADDVRAIALDINSPGGEVEGCFDLADTIFAARGSKPIWAILGENAYSAAYALASAADRVTVPRTGGTGSIGVIAMHADLSGALDKSGIGVTLITYGARKGETSPFQPLAKDARARLQAEVDATGELFVATVARNRKLQPDQVRETEAGTFQGAAGLEQGLADAVMAPDTAFRALLATL